MMSANHVVFAFSFASVFLVCYVGSQFLGSVLNDAGYDLFAISLGHEKQPENMPAQLNQHFLNNQLAQLVAVALAVATSAFIFLKFSQSQFKSVYTCVRLTHTPLESKKPVLDSQGWKEFPLVKKTIVSPNTAMWAVIQLLSDPPSD